MGKTRGGGSAGRSRAAVAGRSRRLSRVVLVVGRRELSSGCVVVVAVGCRLQGVVGVVVVQVLCRFRHPACDLGLGILRGVFLDGIFT